MEPPVNCQLRCVHYKSTDFATGQITEFTLSGNLLIIGFALSDIEEYTLEPELIKLADSR